LIRTEAIQIEDYSELAQFLAHHWDREPEFWMERFHFLWDKNPAFPQDPLRGFVVKQNDKIKGFIGKFPVKIQLDGHEAISSNAIGMVIDEDLRGRGLGKQLKSKHTESSKGKLIFATTPNKISMKINMALGFQPLPRGIGDYNLYSILPINRWETTVLYLHLLKSSRSVLSLKTLGSAFGRRKQFENQSNLRVEKIHYADTKFDRLWERTKTIYKNTHTRTADIINWYLLPTRYADREIYAAYDGNEVAGYIVVRSSAIKKIRFMLCLDLWIAPENSQNTIKSLLFFAKEQAAQKNFAALVVPHFSKSLSATFDTIGLFKAIGKKRNDLFLMPENFTGSITIENSYFTYMSGDRFLGKAVI